ncbi:MAG: hypothetical protein KME42_26350 [Tildeniella nuda ZEHNDER 1965/U140]|jgi:hypothetical protein|nr:hypothetical protein [Tildeniella nuda ZEHNDER 1965/U140]
MTTKTSEDYILPPDSIRTYQLAVYFENEWLWKEKDPVRRANASKRLAKLTAKLAELEAAEAQNFVEQTVVDDVA